ncbi:MAG TPA: hypothetical protein V6C82_05720 [Chroococcales cyanobacterium]|jgi:hypothetical protein
MRQIGMSEADLVKLFTTHPKMLELGERDRQNLSEVLSDVILANNRKISTDLIRLGVLMGSITSDLKENQASF